MAYLDDNGNWVDDGATGDQNVNAGTSQDISMSTVDTPGTEDQQGQTGANPVGIISALANAGLTIWSDVTGKPLQRTVGPAGVPQTAPRPATGLGSNFSMGTIILVLVGVVAVVVILK